MSSSSRLSVTAPKRLPGSVLSESRQSRRSARRFCVVGLEGLPLPAVPYEACEKITTRVTLLSLMRYRSNDYSVPSEYREHRI